MARNNQRGRNNNNPEGHNQHTGVMDYARERPVTAAAAAAAAVGAGVFLWSRRSQISEQLSGLSDQIGSWSEQMRSSRQGSESEFETAGTQDLGSVASGSQQKRTTGSMGSGRL